MIRTQQIKNARALNVSDERAEYIDFERFDCSADQMEAMKERLMAHEVCVAGGGRGAREPVKAAGGCGSGRGLAGCGGREGGRTRRSCGT